MIIDHKRYQMFELRKVRRDYEQAPAYASEGHLALIYTKTPKYGGRAERWLIPLRHGGKLAMSFPVVQTLGASYDISFAKLTEAQRQQVREAVQYIVKNGDPIDNDESVFAGMGG